MVAGIAKIARIAIEVGEFLFPNSGNYGSHGNYGNPRSPEYNPDVKFPLTWFTNAKFDIDKETQHGRRIEESSGS
jgi:hypothetical protein